MYDYIQDLSFKVDDMVRNGAIQFYLSTDWISQVISSITTVVSGNDIFVSKTKSAA